MSNNPAGLLPVLTYAVAVLAAVPLAVLAVVVGHWVRPFARAVRYVAVGVAGLAAVGLLALAVLVDPGAAVAVATAVVLAALLLVALPVAIARAVLVRTGASTERALWLAVVGWPVGMLASLGVFVALGGPARYNLTFLDGPAAVAGWLLFAAVLILGPTLVGLAVAGLTARRRAEESSA